MENTNQFKIRQLKDNEYIILKLCESKKTKGYLWWKKTIKTKKYYPVDEYGRFFQHINIENFVFYKTLEDAKKWILDYNKYPIDYFC
jgi:hypothetical protein